MKKLLFILSICLSVTFANAQKMNVTSAYTYLSRGYLDKAKDAIDKAVYSPDTKNDAKAWYYRGEIYFRLHTSQNEKYKSLVKDALDTAYFSFNNAKDLDKEKEFSDGIKNGLIGCSVELYNKGVSKFQSKSYVEAFDIFEKTAKVRYSFGMTDSVYTFALYNGALAAENTKNKEYDAKAKDIFKKLYALKYKQAYVFTAMSNYAKADGDTVKYLKIIQQGREAMPDNLELLIAEANIYLQQHKSKEAQDLLKLALQKDPNNAILHMVVGQKYDEAGDFVNAEAEYKKAVELDQKNFDAIYNLGALYFNYALEILKQADKLPMGDPKYDTEKARADVLFDKSIPCLEKAETIDPNDKSTLQSLKQLYVRKKNTEGSNRVDAKLGGKK
ncbi:MAG: tetratricopeptide repeat protein [Bacteroidota bacterium]